MAQEQQQGNGLIGGGIGLGLGGLASAYSAYPFSRMVEDKLPYKMKDKDKLVSSIHLLYQLGLPITTALIGSTLTD